MAIRSSSGRLARLRSARCQQASERGVVNAIAAAPDGGIYIGGAFTDVGDANGDRIVKWSGSAWSSSEHRHRQRIPSTRWRSGQDGKLYVGGIVHESRRWQRRLHQLSGTARPGHRSAPGMNGDVYALAIGPDGTLYATGAFTTAGGVTVNGIAKWNGTAWTAVGTGVGVAGGKFG